jgi:hypothetical protein
VVQRGEQLGFALKAGEPFCVTRKRIGKDFDGNFALQSRVLCPIHFAHSIRADLGGDLIGANASAGD